MAVRCARIDEETAEEAITRIIQKLGYSQLKPEQLKVIMEFVCGKDVFAVLPTGFGKTLCYACLPLVLPTGEGSTIKHDHSESLIAYYTRWLVAYSAPFCYLRLLLHHVT